MVKKGPCRSVRHPFKKKPLRYGTVKNTSARRGCGLGERIANEFVIWELLRRKKRASLRKQWFIASPGITGREYLTSGERSVHPREPRPPEFGGKRRLTFPESSRETSFMLLEETSMVPGRVFRRKKKSREEEDGGKRSLLPP